MVAINVLEAIRFYVSFACSFAFAERKLMEGNAKIIKMIARDEALHLNGTQHMINLMQSGKDDPDMVEIAQDCQQQAIEIFKVSRQSINRNKKKFETLSYGLANRNLLYRCKDLNVQLD